MRRSTIEDDSDLSVSDDNAEGGVGLSNPQLSQGRRRMLDLVNRLHSTGVQIDLDLPMIAVIGSQSAGKSSLIESISGITLPRAAGTCTRCPTECRLSHSDEPWRCIVTLRFVTDKSGQPLRQVRNETFGKPITDKADVEERIRRAQRAILNPETSSTYFLQGEDEDPEVPQLTFSTNLVSLQISGKDVADLSFVDLPGLIASVGNGGNSGDIDLVRNLVYSYIERDSCLILLTVACETDFENQGAHSLASDCDPEGMRTIGVLTKPDRIPSGEEDRWLRFIRNQYEELRNNWYCVKQPSSNTLKQGITWADARRQEDEFFSMTPPWSTLEYTYQQYLCTSNLTTRLSVILSDLIGKRLPEIQEELQALLRETEEEMHKLPKPPSNDPMSEVLHLLGNFNRDLSRHLEGTPGEDGLLQIIRPAQEKFKQAIRATAPDFRPYEMKHARSRTLPNITFLSNEEDPHNDEGDLHSDEEDSYHTTGTIRLQWIAPQLEKDDVFFIEEVLARAQKARTRELPGHYPFVVQESYIKAITEKWRSPASSLFRTVQMVLAGNIKNIIAEHFESFGNGGLQQRVLLVLNDHLKAAGEKTIRSLDWLLELEERPYTLNTHYYADYKNKFLAYYKACRQQDPALVANLTGHENRNLKDPITPFAASVTKVITGLTEVGISGIQPTDLPKLLPADPFEPALQIMSDVRGYFQVAYKRYTDNIPLAIDREFVRGLPRDLEQAIYKGLGISGPDGLRVCKELVQEHPSIASRREELQKKWERLNTASQELVHLGI